MRINELKGFNVEERGNYLIEPIIGIGSGGFGVVEKINLYNTDRYLCGLYARKILRPEKITKDLLVRFEREVRYQADCTHQNVVQIFICNMQAPIPWFVMELGICSLDDEIKNKTLSREQKIEIVKMILAGVKCIHSKGYLHRDIKPLNVLKFPDGSYKISDFGLAKNVAPNANTQLLTQIGHYPATPKYFDQGVFINGYSNQSDIYSLGVLIEELEIEGFDDIVNKCTHRLLKHRFLNIDQILVAIEELHGARQ